MPSCKKEIQRSVFKLSFLSCSKTNGEVKPFMTADFLGTFFLTFLTVVLYGHLIITDSLLRPLGEESPYMDTFYDPPRGPY